MHTRSIFSFKFIRLAVSAFYQDDGALPYNNRWEVILRAITEEQCGEAPIEEDKAKRRKKMLGCHQEDGEEKRRRKMLRDLQEDSADMRRTI